MKHRIYCNLKEHTYYNFYFVKNYAPNNKIVVGSNFIDSDGRTGIKKLRT